jgi:hypothetical protein
MTKVATPRFEVLINGRRACVAGVDTYGVLNVILSRVKRNPLRFPKQRPGQHTKRTWSREQLDVYVGGLEIDGEDERNDRHLVWLKRRIRPGDKIMVRVLPVGPVSKPKGESPRQPPRSGARRTKRGARNAA